MNHKRSKNPPEFPSFYGPSSYRPVFTQPGPAFVNTTGPDVKIDCDYYIPKKFQNIRSPPPNPNPPRRITKKVRFNKEPNKEPINIEPNYISNISPSRSNAFSISHSSSQKGYNLDKTEDKSSFQTNQSFILPSNRNHIDISNSDNNYSFLDYSPSKRTKQNPIRARDKHDEMKNPRINFGNKIPIGSAVEQTHTIRYRPPRPTNYL